jgi:aminoglycoside phosphotransferase (APT) family kinase protein
MAHEWDAEISLDSDQALELIKAQFPELNPHSIQQFNAGWDNTAYLINNEYIFRFPRRSVAVPLLEHELYILPKIASLLPISIPIPLWYGKPSQKFPWPFLGYRLLKGKTACELNLSDDERSALAKPLAQFLSALHSIPITEEYKRALPLDTWKKLDLEMRIPKLKDNLIELESLGLLHHKQQLYLLVQEASTLRMPQIHGLIHGDLYIRHLLIDEHHNLTGVIDWGDIHIGDIALDLAIAHSFLPPSAHDVFRKEYGYIDQDTWLLARFRALFHSTVLVLHGHKSGPSLMQEGLRSLEYIAEQVQ